MVSVPARKSAARYLMGTYEVSERRACRVTRSSRATIRYRSIRPPQDALRKRIREIAQVRIRYGYKRIHVLLRREGVHANHKRIYRLYCEEGLQLRTKRPRRNVSAAHRRERIKATQPNQYWSMDFVADRCEDGKRFRALTVVDIYTRECLAIYPGKQLKSEDVVKALDSISSQRGTPTGILCDNGSEFSGHLLDLWAYHNKVSLMFSRPGKPTDNAYIESFNGSLRDECLNTQWFSKLEDAKVKLEAWRQEHNDYRPHRALNTLTPSEFAASGVP